MITNKPEVVLPDAPPIPAHLFDKDQSIVWAAAWEALGKHVVDTLTRPAAGEFVMVRKEAIDWLNGEGPEGFECPPDRYFRGEPPRYWWRSVFREKAGLSAAPQQPRLEVDITDAADDPNGTCPTCHQFLRIDVTSHIPEGWHELKDRLLVALERAALAETALRELADECDNDMTPGWEERVLPR